MHGRLDRVVFYEGGVLPNLDDAYEGWAKAVAKLKKGPGGTIQVSGSGNLLQTVLKNDPVHELDLCTFPALLGSGKRLFEAGVVPGAWKMTESHTSTTGVTIQ